ncbi:TetR/AcrR family transcriptional regulator [Methanooceanicella nereidis]|nr:TetR/AcrR family transcriptional regulator [Methanocella sp. CWC-04]
MADKKQQITEVKIKAASVASTKDRILDAALELFARKGFDAVSMREIAEEVGIQKSSLYSHFKSKDEILDGIMEFPATELTLVGPKEELDTLIDNLGLEGFMMMSNGVFRDWMKSQKMEKVWRVLCIEMYHNEKIQAFFSNFIDGAISFWTLVFSKMAAKGMIKPLDPAVLANEYFGQYIYLFIEYFLIKYDNTPGSFKRMAEKSIEGHMIFFVEALKK